MYLTEPPSLNEVKRKRKLSEYYDKIIQGNAAMTVEDVKINNDVQMIFQMGLSKAMAPVAESKFKSNARFKEEIDKSRENILEHAIEHHLSALDKIEDDSQLDD